MVSAVNRIRWSSTASQKFFVHVDSPRGVLVNGTNFRPQDERVVALFVVGNEPTRSKMFRGLVQPHERATIEGIGPLSLGGRLNDGKKRTNVLKNEKCGE